MTEMRRPARGDRREEQERRVRRGVVAGYVHEISARHRHAPMAATVRVAAPRVAAAV